VAADRTKRGAQDRSKINLDQEREIRYWTREFGVSEAALTTTVAKVGSSVQRDGFRRRRNSGRETITRNKSVSRSSYYEIGVMRGEIADLRG
jgi:uncharacterized protein DUF3606